MNRQCKNCGAELPEGASFCPHCAQSQIERKEVKPPHLWRKKLRYVLLGAAVVVAVGLAIYLPDRPQTFEGGAAVTYTDREGNYDLLVTFFPGDITNNRPIGSKTVTASPGETNMDTPMLGIYQNGKLADTEQFFAKVQSCTLEAVPQENGTLVVETPGYNPDYLPSARMSYIYYTGESGTHELHWTITMKNGDVIRLKQTYEVIPLARRVYTPEDTPLDTIEELKALLKRIEQEVPADTIVDIYLPPVTYEGGVSILSRAVNLYGGTDGNARTTFTGTLSVHSDSPANVMLFNMDFIGHGGTGLSAAASVYMGGCTFTGWDVGAVATDGGMIGVERCEFRENGIGFLYRSASFRSFNEVFPDCIIADNDIGVQFALLSGNICIDFAGSTFSGNRIDVDNPIDYPINLSGAVFE